MDRAADVRTSDICRLCVTDARWGLRVAAGCTRGPSSCTPSGSLPHPKFSQESRRITLVVLGSPPTRHQRRERHAHLLSLRRPRAFSAAHERCKSILTRPSRPRGVGVRGASIEGADDASSSAECSRIRISHAMKMLETSTKSIDLQQYMLRFISGLSFLIFCFSHCSQTYGDWLEAVRRPWRRPCRTATCARQVVGPSQCGNQPQGWGAP